MDGPYFSVQSTEGWHGKMNGFSYHKHMHIMHASSHSQFLHTHTYSHPRTNSAYMQPTQTRSLDSSSLTPGVRLWGFYRFVRMSLCLLILILLYDSCGNLFVYVCVSYLCTDANILGLALWQSTMIKITTAAQMPSQTHRPKTILVFVPVSQFAHSSFHIHFALWECSWQLRLVKIKTLPFK